MGSKNREPNLIKREKFLVQVPLTDKERELVTKHAEEGSMSAAAVFRLGLHVLANVHTLEEIGWKLTPRSEVKEGQPHIPLKVLR